MACPKEAELVPFKNLEVPRNSIQLVNKLGAGQFGEVWAGLCVSLSVSMCVCLSVYLSVSHSGPYFVTHDPRDKIDTTVYLLDCLVSIFLSVSG